MNGNKTYIVAGVAALATAAKYLGYIDEVTYQAIIGFLGAAGLATMRSAIGNVKSEVADAKVQVRSLMAQSHPLNFISNDRDDRAPVKRTR